MKKGSHPLIGVCNELTCLGRTSENKISLRLSFEGAITDSTTRLFSPENDDKYNIVSLVIMPAVTSNNVTLLTYSRHSVRPRGS
jgi:hypothetical protein